MRMPWLPSLNLGIGGVDDDHRHIFEVMDEMRASLGAGNLSGVRALFEELRTATLAHFREEEALMERYAYPAAAEHLMEHDMCRTALIRLEAAIQGDRPDRIGDLLADFTAGYFRGVLCHDGRLARFLQEVGETSPHAPCLPLPPAAIRSASA